MCKCSDETDDVIVKVQSVVVKIMLFLSDL